MGNEVAVRQTDAIARPESFEGLMQMAKVLVDSGFLPSAINTAAKAAAIMVAGREIGLTGMQSFRELYSVKGQIGMSTRLIAAFFKRTGGRYTFLERNDGKCTVRLTLADGDEHDFTMTRAEADQAGYTKEKDKDGQPQIKFNWRSNPTGMLSNNCLKGAIRLWCPECLLDVMGPAAVQHETVDAEVLDGEVVEQDAPSGNGNGHTEEPEEPPHGFTTWGEKMQKAFWARTNALKMDEAATLREFGVKSMKDYTDYAEQASLLLKIVEAAQAMTFSWKELHEALVVEYLAQYTGTLQDAAASMNDLAAHPTQSEPEPTELLM